MSITAELSDRASQRQKVRAYLESHPCQIVSQQTLKQISGADAVRNRIGELRRGECGEAPMHIETVYEDGSKLASYRFVPWVPLGRSADMPTEQPALF